MYLFFLPIFIFFSDPGSHSRLPPPPPPYEEERDVLEEEMREIDERDIKELKTLLIDSSDRNDGCPRR